MIGSMKSSYIFLFAKDWFHRTMTSGGGGASYLRRYGRGLVSKPAISLKECWGGYRRTTSGRDGTGERVGNMSGYLWGTSSGMVGNKDVCISGWHRQALA